MVVIRTRRGKTYQFDTSHAATLWIRNFPKLYDGDLNNIEVYTDTAIKDTIQVMEVQKAIDEMIECQGCHSNLKFTIEPTDVAFTVKCPACHTSHVYHVMH